MGPCPDGARLPSPTLRQSAWHHGVGNKTSWCRQQVVTCLPMPCSLASLDVDRGVTTAQAHANQQARGVLAQLHTPTGMAGHGWAVAPATPNPTQSLHTAQRPSPSLHAHPCSCRHSHSWYMSVVTAPGWISTSGMPRGASSSASSCPAMLAAALLMLHGGIRMVVGQGWHAWAGRLGAAIAMLVQ